MRKKGFTLIELMISIGLLSIVLIFMMNTLVKLRDTSVAGGVDTNLLVGKTIITKTLNEDVLSNNGITSYENCSSAPTLNTVTLNLGNGEKRILMLAENDTIFIYNNGNSEEILSRKAPSGYVYTGFTCEDVYGVKRIRIYVKETLNEENESYSEILYYN